MSGDYVLGVSSHFHDAAAALVQGNQIVAAAQEERFSRKKADWRFPEHAIAYCLSQLPGGTRPAAVAYYENPRLKIDRILRNAQDRAPRGAGLWPRTLTTLRELTQDLPTRLQALCSGPDAVHFVPHHKSHAAAAFYPSPFDAAAVLVLDGVGEWSTTSLWSGQNDALSALAELRFPHSLGLFYSAFTQYCGFRVNSGEYKLMGLAPFGSPTFQQKIFDELIELKPDGSFALNMAYFGFDTSLSTTSPLFEMLFGQPARRATDPMTPHYMDIAASAQAVLEQAVLRLAATALKRARQHNLCLAGGVALNCVANARLLREVPGLEGLWIQPAAGDAGGALGAALDLARHRMRRTAAPARSPSSAPPPVPGADGMAGSLLGPEFSDAQIRAALTRVGLVFEEPGSDPALARQTAEALADNQIVGHFHGRMEFGPRALGNRSILADPRRKDALNWVNRRIKFREDWRPLAPIVLAEHAADLFESPTDSPYMLLVAPLKPALRGDTTLAAAKSRGLSHPMQLQDAVTSDYSAVTHVDFSARLQTVDAGAATRARAILEAFHAATGCPMLMNTSFNVRGEPIVCSPRDAIACFLNTHLDVLAIGPFLVRKSAQPDWVKTKIGRTRFAAD